MTHLTLKDKFFKTYVQYPSYLFTLVFFLVTIKLVEGLFGNWLNIDIIKKILIGACNTRTRVWVVSMPFGWRVRHYTLVKLWLPWRCLNHIGFLFILIWRMFQTDLWFDACNSCFLPILLDFNADPVQFKSSPSICYLFTFVPYFFCTIYFIWNDLWNWLFFLISPLLIFFIFQIW
jgi:hypothetical protein